MDIKLISTNKEAVYRVRRGKYRLVYEIDEQSKTIILTMFFLEEKGIRKTNNFCDLPLFCLYL